MVQQTLKFKVGLYLALGLSVAVVLFTVLIAWKQRNELFDAVASQVTELSQVIVKSTRLAMLQNEPTDVSTIIHNVAELNGIERIRIFSREGTIKQSTYAPEIGQVVDRKAEGCAICHNGARPLDEVPAGKRTWTFKAPDGQRLLGSMEVIRNQPSCYNASCHHHPKDTRVLGVLEIRYSTGAIDQRIRRNALGISAFSLGFALVASLAIGFFIHHLVYLPLRDLESGARRVSSGDLEKPIPVRSGDEFGVLAESFNAMTAALRNSRSELREWGRTLEQKVAQRTEELRLAQAEAAHGEKLASVGMLASGIAHELNNPLTGVLTFSVLLREKMKDGTQDAEDLDLVIRETRRCGSIIKRLLDFARDRPPEKKFADLNAIVEETVRVVEWPAHLHDINIALDLDRDLPQVWVDPDQIKQVVMNLLVNAQHAIDGAGRIDVRTRRMTQAKALEAGGAARPMAELSVADTGCGIPKENLRRIFDPFFTTKIGIGTGLGLSVSHSIIEAHGGTIEVESEEGKGSTFRICLPLVRTPELAERASEGSNA